MTEEEHIVPSYVLSILTFIYISIFAAGIVGNFMIILVVWKNKEMKNAANFFLISLSTADLMIILFCLPLPIYEMYYTHWMFGSFVCKLTQYLQYVSVTSSILTILAISVERLFVIKYPLKTKIYFTKSKTLRVIVAVWILSILNSIPSTFISRTTDDDSDSNINWTQDDSANITLCYNDTLGHEWYILWETLVFYVLPGCTICIIYANIIRALRECTLVSQMIKSELRARSRQQLQLTVALGGVIGVYFVCLLPFNVLVVLAVFWPQVFYEMHPMDYTILLTISRVLFFINSCINPLFYGFLSTKFRRAFARLFTRKPDRLQRRNALMDSDTPLLNMSRDPTLLTVALAKRAGSMDTTTFAQVQSNGKKFRKRYSVV